MTKSPSSNLYYFLASTNPPKYGHKLNDLETVGNLLLYPFAASIGTFSMKDPSLVNRITSIAVIIITSLITLLGAIIKGIGYALPHVHFEATDENVPFTDPMKLRQCYELAQELKAVFLEAGLTRTYDDEVQPAFAMVSGTALGAVRHGGIIPWDDDCDFAIFQEDEARFLALKDSFAAKGIEVQNIRFDSTYKLRFSNDEIRKRYGDTKEIGDIDVFVFSKRSDGSYTYDKQITRSKWPTELFTSDEVKEGFNMLPFGSKEKGLTLPILKSPDHYLARYYGDNFMEHGIRTHGHFRLDFGSWGSVSVPFLKFGAHYYKIEKTKNIPGIWE